MNIAAVFDYFVGVAPFALGALIWVIRIEKRLSTIETNINWVCKSLPNCIIEIEKVEQK